MCGDWAHAHPWAIGPASVPGRGLGASTGVRRGHHPRNSPIRGGLWSRAGEQSPAAGTGIGQVTGCGSSTAGGAGRTGQLETVEEGEGKAGRREHDHAQEQGQVSRAGWSPGAPGLTGQGHDEGWWGACG